MTEAKHTPGPWVVFVGAASDSMIFSVMPAGRAGDIADNIQNGADADLIAAAPDMLRVLRSIEATLPHMEGRDMATQSLLKDTRAAIAKATGAA